MPSPRRFPPHGRLKMEPMTADQAATPKRLAEAAYEREAFKPNLTRAEADVRIATLTAKLKLLGEPPHTRLSDVASRPAAMVCRSPAELLRRARC